MLYRSKKTIEDNNKWFDFVNESTSGMSSGDAQSIFGTVRPFVSGEKGLQMYEAYESITKKKGEIAERPQTVSPYEAFQGASSGVQSATAKSVYGQTPGLEGVEFAEPTPETPTQPKATDYNTAASYLSKFVNAKPEVFEQVKAGLQKNTGLDLSGITQNSLKEPETPTGGGTGEPEEIARTDIAYWEKTFAGIKNEEEYNRQYDLLKQSKTSKQYEPKPYKEMLKNEVKAMASEMKGLLTSDNKFKDDDAKATYEKHQRIYEQKVRELLAKYPEMDKSQFPKYLPVDQIKKVGFWKGKFTGGGVATGDYSVIDTKGW